MDCDLWRSPAWTLAEGIGDCDDHAILATSMLLAAGVHAWLVVGTLRGEGHAWVEGHDHQGWFLLEATRKPVTVTHRRLPGGYVGKLVVQRHGCVEMRAA